MTALDSNRWEDIIKIIKITIDFIYFRVTMMNYNTLLVHWNYLSAGFVCRLELIVGWNYLSAGIIQIIFKDKVDQAVKPTFKLEVINGTVKYCLCRGIYIAVKIHFCRRTRYAEFAHKLIKRSKIY